MSVICLALFVFQTLNWMTMTLQRQLGYMNPDGSFSMFRDYRRHTPSIWLTAFVLETLSNANEADWILQFYVSSDLLNKIALFLVDHQLPNGRWRSSSSIISCPTVGGALPRRSSAAQR